MATRPPLVLLALAGALVVAAALVAGPSAPNCVPVEPTDPVCQEASDCTWCMYRTRPASPDDCTCALCNDAVPMVRATCEENAAAYDRHCGHLDCPLIACEQPPPVACVDGACVQAPEVCGDPTARARYDECRAATTEGPCEAAGGTWTIVGLSPEPSCQCPTGQGGCPCDGPGDCLSACIAPLSGGSFGCDGAQGRCSSVSLTVGCHCWFMEDGTAQGLCAD